VWLQHVEAMEDALTADGILQRLQQGLAHVRGQVLDYVVGSRPDQVCGMIRCTSKIGQA
jgi:hypothetical protein